MTPFVSLLVVVFGLVLGLLGVMRVFSSNLLNRFYMVVGLLIASIGFVGGLVYDSQERTKAITDIVARTITVRGMVDVKEERWSLKSPPPKKGGHLCFITLKELPYTFALSEPDDKKWICADIKIRDIVKVTFVLPLDNRHELEVEALEFIDLTYEINAYNSKYPTDEPAGDQRNVE